MRLRGVRLIVYLDNILILDQEEASLRTLATVAETLSSLGFVINIKKSIFEPAETLDYGCAWKKWSSWCSERQISVFPNSITPIIEFIMQQFREGKQYSTLNLYR